MSYVQDRLGEKLFGEKDVRTVLEEIYNIAMEDRNTIKKLFDSVIEEQNANKTDKDGKIVNANTAIFFNDVIDKYMRLMKNSNDQLLNLAKIIQRVLVEPINAEGSGRNLDDEERLAVLIGSDKIDSDYNVGNTVKLR